MNIFTQSSHHTNDRKLCTFVQRYECDDCGLAFSHISQLTGYQRIHKVEKAQRYAKAFRHHSPFATLQRIFILDQHFECSQCGKAFNRASNFIPHRNTHNEWNHTNVRCQKAFRFLSSFNTHQKFHVGKRLNLTWHQKIHIQKKVFCL